MEGQEILVEQVVGSPKSHKAMVEVLEELVAELVAVEELEEDSHRSPSPMDQ